MLMSLGNDLTVRQRKKLSELDMPIGNMSGGLTGGSRSHSSRMGKLHDLLNMKCQEYCFHSGGLTSSGGTLVSVSLRECGCRV